MTYSIEFNGGYTRVHRSFDLAKRIARRQATRTGYAILSAPDGRIRQYAVSNGIVRGRGAQ